MHNLNKSSEKNFQEFDDFEHYDREKERLYRRAHPELDEIRTNYDYRQGWLKGVYQHDL
jgi:hypothetical protein